MEKARFDINPHVIRQLGTELISDSTTALMELIKNSYDADATYVNITINTNSELEDNDLFYKKHKGYIVIDDNGFGMSKDTILKSWLIISYSNKRAIDGLKTKTPKGRTPLGEKGLGRLSTQRLADICEIYTKEDGKDAYHVGFNWNEFDAVEKLSDVNVEFKVADLNKKHGTKLILTDLLDVNTWTGDEFERFKALLCQLISPYEETKPFDVYLMINGENIDLTLESKKLNKLNVCDFHFSYTNQKMTWNASINLRKLIGNDFETYSSIILQDSGKRFLDSFFQDKKKRYSDFSISNDRKLLTVSQSFFLSDAVNKNFFVNSPCDPGNFYGRIQEFTFTKSFDNSDWWNVFYKSFDEYKSFVQNQLGIKIYRNGFAIKPYGIDANDWLKLGSGQTRGASYYGLRPENIIGYIAIDEAINENLKDKTDREGLIENEYYRSFKSLMGYLIDRINEKITDLRRFYNDYKASLSSDNTKVKSLNDAFKEISKQSKRGREISDDYDKTQQRLASVKNKIDKVIKSDNNNLFSKEDSLSKETLKEIASILNESNDVLAKAHDALHDSLYLNEALKIIKPKLEALEAQIADFSELASLGLISEMVSHDLGQISHRMLGKGMELENVIKHNSTVSNEQIYSTISFIKSTVTSLKAQIKHLDSSMKYNRESKESFSIYKMLDQEEYSYYIKKLEQYGIALIVEDVNDFYVNINEGKLIQVFDNLMNNAIYWLRFHNIKNNKIPTITIKIDKPWVYFEDNGLGVEPNVEDTLFEPFVTRKPKGEGRGLGLFIIRQLLDSNNCDIILDDKRNSEDRRYCFSINMTGILNDK